MDAHTAMADLAVTHNLVASVKVEHPDGNSASGLIITAPHDPR